MITRTIQTTEVNVLCMDIKQGEPFNTTVTLPRTYKDNAAMLKAAAAVIDNEDTKAVHIVASEVNDTLYGMKETDFIANADILPARTVKEHE
jgi:hypothetical protein